MKKKILPISVAPIRGYSHQAALLSILLSYNQCKPWICNNYIQIFSLYNLKESDRSGTLDFLYTDYGDFRNYEYSANPWLRFFEMPIFMMKHNDFDIIEFIINAINSDYYMQIEVDKYYICKYDEYHKYHDMHWIYIYGYDKETNIFNCCDNFLDGVFSYENIDIAQILSGFRGSYEEFAKKMVNSEALSKIEKIGPSFTMFQILNNHADSNYTELNEIKVKKIINQLKAYLCESNLALTYIDTKYYVFGINCYNELIVYVEKAITYNHEIDIRAYYSMMDHKSLMIWRLQYMTLILNLKLDLFIDIYNDLYMRFKKIIYLIIKYNLSKEQTIKDNIIVMLIKCFDDEKATVHNLIDFLEHNENALL
ncbi:hypothetical protein QA584_26530 [Anaerocolumna sp. AGMB13025]|uniref:hypothetical protein n=1 Tax=Anaerocolumna sp. AGMB13025 TaxID=3039116 RepID=UPI00241F1ACD|nr:hypothetical protein [Anaerocolumna sp. AGMB13025]WFR57125.1 hypothetical protein QA584_26530 [Anaerocolumna sp. AGMB13025]